LPLLPVRDTQLFYEEWGKGSPLLFIHGLGSSTEDWSAQIEAFRDEYRVIAVDLRGHGRSEKVPGPRTVQSLADDVAALLRALGAVPAHVVGVSLGGMVSLELAACHPEVVRTLTVANTGPEVIARSLGDRWKIWQRYVLLRFVSMRRLGELLSGRLLPGPEHAQNRTAFVDRYAQNSKEVYRDTLGAIVGWSVVARLPAISCPVLVIAADQDYSPLEAKKAIADGVQNGRLVIIPDSRHATPIERPGAFNEALGGFLAEDLVGVRGA
jgi:3-oxoadipate enol-lactonase